MGTEPIEYCRDIERYLCQKNDGHLIRIVGPSFERVSSWATQGVPFKVACRGIDRYFERYYAKPPRGGRRRPVQIDFCEADVLDVFEEWRRAIGLAAGVGTEADGEPDKGAATRRGPSLPAHLERVLLKLTAARAKGSLDAGFDQLLDRVADELDRARSDARGIRGALRQDLVARLATLDAELLRAARVALADEVMRKLTAEAEQEISSFRSGMTTEAWIRASASVLDRLVREELQLPVIAFIG